MSTTQNQLVLNFTFVQELVTNTAEEGNECLAFITVSFEKKNGMFRFVGSYSSKIGILPPL